MATFIIWQTQVGKNEYIYPDEDLAGYIDFTPVGEADNYACVDEDRLTPDEDTTYVWWNDVVAGLDLYELPDHDPAIIGDINYIQVYVKAKTHETAQSIDGVYKIVLAPWNDPILDLNLRI